MNEQLVYSSPEVIELLETYLATARQMRFGHVAIAMTAHPNIAAIDYAGDISLEQSTHEALGLARGRLDQSIKNWTLPERDPSLDTSYVVYNVANGPLGFDFITWLVDAEMTRIREGGPWPLKVGFYLGSDADKRMKLDNRQMWLDKVFRPALSFIGAVEDDKAIRGRSKQVYVSRDIVAAAKAGDRVPSFSVEIDDDVPRDYVTITLREADHHPHRNSNIEAWIKFANDLKRNCYDVLFVRDTAKANERIDGFYIYPKASLDLTTRMALYNVSEANLFTSNGPSTIALYGFRDIPWLTFIPIEEETSTYIVNTKRFWRENMGFEPPGQYPWAGEKQRVVWEADTYENISAAWERLGI